MTDTMVVKPSTSQEMESVDTEKLSSRKLHKLVKHMVTHNQLPTQRESAVNPNGLFLPPFDTFEGKQIVEAGHLYSELYVTGLSFSSLLAFAGGIGSVSSTYLLSTGENYNEIFLTVLMNVFGGSLALGLVSSVSTIGFRPKIHKQLVTNMSSASIKAFTVWAKNRYGINLRGEELSRVADLITVGKQFDEDSLRIVVDDLTGDKYKIFNHADGSLYLTKQTEENRQETTTLAIAAKPGLGKESLPSDVVELCDQLTASITELRTQELSVETEHAVERTENAVQTVLTQYCEIAKLSSSEDARQELMDFLNEQMRFINRLLQEHVQELKKRMAVEISAVTEATRLNGLLLAKSPDS
jgi:hypothetical protein